jgi:hypothetical protein
MRVHANPHPTHPSELNNTCTCALTCRHAHDEVLHIIQIQIQTQILLRILIQQILLLLLLLLLLLHLLLLLLLLLQIIIIMRALNEHHISSVQPVSLSLPDILSSTCRAGRGLDAHHVPSARTHVRSLTRDLSRTRRAGRRSALAGKSRARGLRARARAGRAPRGHARQRCADSSASADPWPAIPVC